MVVVETNIGSKRKFQFDGLIAFGEVNKDTFKATLKMPDGKLFNMLESSKDEVNKYSQILTAFNTWVAAELP